MKLDITKKKKKLTHLFIRKKLMIAYLEFIDMSIYTRIKVRIFFSYPQKKKKKKKSKHKLYIFF